MFDGASLTKGAQKLLRREDTLREWIEDGRDNYELARAFHVPIGDVRTVVALLNIARPEEYVTPAREPTRSKGCSNCGKEFQAPRYRFRCDDCLELHSTWTDQTYFMPAVEAPG